MKLPSPLPISRAQNMHYGVQTVHPYRPYSLIRYWRVLKEIPKFRRPFSGFRPPPTAPFEWPPVPCSGAILLFGGVSSGESLSRFGARPRRGRSIFPLERMTARSMTFWSSRIFPGQEYASRADSRSARFRSLSCRRSWRTFAAKCSARGRMASSGLRPDGGARTGKHVQPVEEVLPETFPP